MAKTKAKTKTKKTSIFWSEFFTSKSGHPANGGPLRVLSFAYSSVWRTSQLLGQSCNSGASLILNLAQYGRHVCYVRLRGREKVVAVHCSGKSERDAGMPEMPEITRAEFDHQKLEAGHSLVAVGWVAS